MSRLIYMDETIQQMGKKNPKETQKLIDNNNVIHGKVTYLEIDESEPIVRKTLDGKPLVELNEPMALIVNTKVPHKWVLQDTETGEIYRGTTNTEIGKQWEKIIDINKK